MARYLASCMATYRKQALGLGLFLAWNYYSFFSCGLVPVTRIIRSSERVWMWVGLLVALASVVLLLVSARTSLVERRWFGVAAAALPLLKAGQTCPPQALDVFYLRRPQAERERLKRLSGQQ